MVPTSVLRVVGFTWKDAYWDKNRNKDKHVSAHDIDFSLCHNCGFPQHCSDKCKARQKLQGIRDLAYEASGLIQREHKHRLLSGVAGTSHFKLSSPKNTKHAVLLARIPATTSPETLEDARKKLPNGTCV